MPGYSYQRYCDDLHQDFINSIVLTLSIAEWLQVPPRLLDDDEHARPLGRTHHIDTGLFAQFLRELATERGEAHVLDDMKGVSGAEDGSIASLTKGEERQVELTVDCTGFYGMILKRRIGGPFVSYSNHQ